MVSFPLPIDVVLPQLRQALAVRDAVVLQAPPGAGKTTRVPLALLDEPWLAGRSILMLEPRRLAASNAARFMAGARGGEVGGLVGYTIRYQRKVSAATRVEVVTEGVLARRLQRDPSLEGVGLVIFDEFHERNLQSDLALALCRDVQLGLRDDLKLLVMSATLAGEPVAALLGDAPLVQSEGRQFPVEVRYAGGDFGGTDVAAATARQVGIMFRETDGDLLVFLPGAAEIERCRRQLQDDPRLTGVELAPLYGDLDFTAQERAILPGYRRKVVLATNIAETSLTIEGVRTVIDSGLARQPRFFPASGLSRLETVRISMASAEQRAGRAGRLGPGLCVRLWSEGQQGELLPFSLPEIRSADLAPLALDLAAWGVPDGAGLAWLDPPPAGALAAARALLGRLGALDAGGHLTPVGRVMTDLPAHPRIARLLLEARERGAVSLGCDLAALLGEPQLLRGDGADGWVDLEERLREQRRTGGKMAGFQRGRDYWRRVMRVPEGKASGDPPQIAGLLAVAWPDRIARETPPGSGRYLLANGSGGRLGGQHKGHRPELLVALEMTGRGGDGQIRVACELESGLLRELFAGQIVTGRRVDWDERDKRIVALEEERFGALVLASRTVTVSADERRQLWCDVIRRRGLELLTWSREGEQFLARCRFVARLGEAEWPDVSPEGLLERLEGWLAPFLGDCRTLSDLGRVDLPAALRGLLSWPQLQTLERLAPERLQVPSGSQIRIDYDRPEEPVLAVKLQELFGLAETPRIGGGRQPLLIELLSPAMRPLQLTRDLRNFWDSVYPEVRKELRGRYPKHPWPDDPWNAEPTRRTKRRS